MLVMLVPRAFIVRIAPHTIPSSHLFLFYVHTTCIMCNVYIYIVWKWRSLPKNEEWMCTRPLQLIVLDHFSYVWLHTILVCFNRQTQSALRKQANSDRPMYIYSKWLPVHSVTQPVRTIPYTLDYFGFSFSFVFIIIIIIHYLYEVFQFVCRNDGKYAFNKREERRCRDVQLKERKSRWRSRDNDGDEDEDTT